MGNTLLILCLTWASFCDCRKNVIPNRLTLLMTALGFGSELILERNFITGLAGFITAGFFGVLLWILGAWGAGDCKLVMALGAWTGWHTCMLITFISMAAFAAAGALRQLRHGTFVKRVTGIAVLVSTWKTGRITGYRSRHSDSRMAFAPFVLLGTLVLPVLQR